MHLDPHFLAALIGLVVSELLPAVSKGKYASIIHTLVAILGKLYTAPGDTAALTAQIEALQLEMGKLKSSQVPARVEDSVQKPSNVAS